MSNIIRLNGSETNTNNLSMSNQGTNTFLELIILSAGGTDMTASQKDLIDYLAERREINRIAPGTASFDVVEMPWNKETLQDDVSFMMRILEKAEEPGVVGRLDYRPDMSIVAPWLRLFAQMICRQGITEKTRYLYECSFFSDDFDPQGSETHLACAAELLKKHSWEDVFPAWNEYLHNCKTPESVLNFCYLFYYYGGQDHRMDDPYDFLGYIYSIIGEDLYWGEHNDLLDSLSVDLLEKAGAVSLYEDAYYKLFDDPKLTAAIKRHR